MQDNASHTAQAVSFAEPHCPLTCLSTPQEPSAAFATAQSRWSHNRTGLPTEKLMVEGLRKGPCLSTGTEDSGPESWTRWGLSKWSQESRSLPEMNTPGRNTCASVTRGDLIIRALSGPKVKCTEREGLAAQTHCAHYNNSRGRNQGVAEVPYNMRKLFIYKITF